MTAAASETTRYRVHSPEVVHEQLDGEVVIVNLDRGAYYSLSGTAAGLWLDFAQGATLPEVIAHLEERFAAPVADLAAAAARFLASLQQEGLLTPRAPEAPAPTLVRAPALPQRQPFTEPLLEKFNDMADLLTLDPIHDVGEDGWPRA